MKNGPIESARGDQAPFDEAEALAAAAFDSAAARDVCPHCLSINFAGAQVCRECHRPLAAEPAAPGAEASPPEPAAWIPAPIAWTPAPIALKADELDETAAEGLAPAPSHRPLFAACPECGAAREEHANSCAECGTSFSDGESVAESRSRKAALVRRVGASAIGACAGLLGYAALDRHAPAPPPQPAFVAHPAARRHALAHRLAVVAVRPAPPIRQASPPATQPAAAPPAPPLAKPIPLAAPLAAATPVPAATPPHAEAPPRVRRIALRAVQPRHASPAPAHRETARIYNPVWVSRPSEEDLARVYPGRARQGGREGRAVIDCVFSGSGALTSCGVASEQPAGLGFGRAALELAPLFRADQANASGWPVAGYRVRVPLAWGAHAEASDQTSSQTALE